MDCTSIWLAIDLIHCYLFPAVCYVLLCNSSRAGRKDEEDEEESEIGDVFFLRGFFCIPSLSLPLSFSFFLRFPSGMRVPPSCRKSVGVRMEKKSEAGCSFSFSSFWKKNGEVNAFVRLLSLRHIFFLVSPIAQPSIALFAARKYKCSEFAMYRDDISRDVSPGNKLSFYRALLIL